MQSAAKQFMDKALEYNELYAPQQQPEPLKLLETERRQRVLAGISRIRLFFCAVMIVAVVSLSIYNNVAMVELGDRLTKQSATLSELQEEGKILQSKLDNAISMSEVAENAAHLMLMGKEESYQITYISLGKGDLMERTTKTPDQQPIQRVIKTVQKLQEYMSSR